MQQECRSTLDNLAAYLDDQVSQEERLEIQMHLGLCPVCQTEAKAQTATKERLRALKLATAQATPSAEVWANASNAWKRQDMARHSRYQLRFALAGAALLLLVMSVVWARRFQTFEFPVALVMKDFREARGQSAVTPKFVTGDADRAARWLREQLKSDFPALNLSLSQAKLTGADVVATNPPVGRLLYATKFGRLAIYLAPGGNRFSELKQDLLDGRSFWMLDRDKDIGLYGWQQEKTGVALVAEQPIPKSRSFLLDARRITDNSR